MIDSVFSILGIDYSALNISDTGLLVCVLTVFIFSMDWIFHFISMVVATLTRRK